MSAASTARPVFEMGLSVAGKGGSPVEPILGGFSRFKAGFGHFFAVLGDFLHFFWCIEVYYGHCVKLSSTFWLFVSKAREILAKI